MKLAPDPADTVREHPVEGNGLLSRPGNPIVLLCAVDHFLHSFLVLSGQIRRELQAALFISFSFEQLKQFC
ncbi:MAG: hypothetical protein IKH73_08075, partial [Erysipelotrichaceae bacterium]|nr:hypothetical protein [Erysipelotrichaceae bacterium]